MLFPNGHALGRRFGYSVMENSRDIEIVGIVRDARYASVREAPPPTMYVPFAQAIPVRVVFDVRTAGDPAAFIPSIREAVRRVQPDLPLTNVSTQTEQIEGRLEQERQLAQIYAAFAALALVVASVGLFGLISYSVTRRTKEMGIRVAIGAARKDVLWLVMRDSLILIAAGIALGLAGAIAARDLVASLLYGVTATDAVAFFVAIAVMVGVSALAGYLPARRAARVDPMVALRYE
jgi:ABC-type antimicrobial peptide transport system permease subunit